MHDVRLKERQTSGESIAGGVGFSSSSSVAAIAAIFTADDSEKIAIVCLNWDSTSSAMVAESTGDLRVEREYIHSMTYRIRIPTAAHDGDDGLIITFSDGTTGAYVVEELLELRPYRERVKTKKTKLTKKGTKVVASGR